MGADFSGYATKAGLKCSDGRVITAEAFKHMDGKRVPLVWQHGHNDPENVLGHVMLAHREDGVYCEAFFNETPKAQVAKSLVQHGDITSLSIYANGLVEKVVGSVKSVLHGAIREVSLVLSGANPGALIDFVAVQHGDGTLENLEDEAVIYTGEEFKLTHADDEKRGPTMEEVYNGLTDEQKEVVHYMIGAAVQEAGGSLAQTGTTEDPKPEAKPENEGTKANTKSDIKPEADPEGDALTHKEGNTSVTKNVFDQTDGKQGEKPFTLTHADVQGILASARQGGSMKAAIEEYALSHGIDSIETLFPDAKAITTTPEWDKRRTEWVKNVLDRTHKTPFSRIKTLSADLTLDEARAKGYVKGNLKKEEFFSVTKRTTGPTTVYKKQKLDRDDILDITDFDVVAWLWGEIRLMLEEELARAILIGDGREVDDDDKIKDPAGTASGDGIRSILNDHDYYAQTFNVNLADASSSYTELVDAIIKNRRYYKGTGQPTMYTTEAVIAEFLTLRDATGRRVYRTIEELASELRVSEIVAVEVMDDVPTVLCILVNLADYNVGTNAGGEITRFDDFDIDYNQYKYLMETRLSGALTKLKSAQIFKAVGSGVTIVTPTAPSQDDDEVTITNTTGVTYKLMSKSGTVTYNGSPLAVDATVTASYPIVLADGATARIKATASSGSYALANNVTDEWQFSYDA